jgi:hypothetical protein
VKSPQNPYQIGIADKPVIGQGDVSSQIRQFKDEEAQSKAPPILPDPLDKIIPVIGNVYVSLITARSMVSQAANNPDIDKEKLEKIKAKIDNINKEILDLSIYLSIIAL